MLSEADISTIRLLYKIKPDITNADEISSDYVPYFVLGEEKDVTNAKIKEAELYIKKAPNLPSGYIDLAEGYVAAKKYSEAVMSLKKALQYTDTEELRGMIYFNLSVTNFYMGQLETAKDYLIRSIQIKNTEEKHYLLGEIYSREGKTDEAIKEYSILMKQNPQNIEYVIALTNTYVIKRQYIKARNTLKQFFENNPNEKNNPRFAPYGILKFGL